MRVKRLSALAAAILLLVVIVVAALSQPKLDAQGIPVGAKAPPFAVPLALSKLEGDANVATHENEGEAGKRAACAVRGPEVLNVCELYEGAPAVLAFFVKSGKCAQLPAQLQSVASEYKGVRFAAVAIMGNRAELRSFIREGHITVPVGYDRDGGASVRYDVATCPQVNFLLPGGKVQAPALLGDTTIKLIQERVKGLVAAARSGGWRPPAAAR